MEKKSLKAAVLMFMAGAIIVAGEVKGFSYWNCSSTGQKITWITRGISWRGGILSFSNPDYRTGLERANMRWNHLRFLRYILILPESVKFPDRFQPCFYGRRNVVPNQKKCIDRLTTIKQSGEAIILFVSHDLKTVEKFCERVILIEKGRIMMDGSPRKTISEYKK